MVVAAGVAIGYVETAEHAAVAASAVAGLLGTLASPRAAFGYLVVWMVPAPMRLHATRRSPG
jgi:hypothetical protein